MYSSPWTQSQEQDIFPSSFYVAVFAPPPLPNLFLYVNYVDCRGSRLGSQHPQGSTQLPIGPAVGSLVHLLAVCTAVACTHRIKNIKIKNYDSYVLSDVTTVTSHGIIYSLTKGF